MSAQRLLYQPMMTLDQFRNEVLTCNPNDLNDHVVDEQGVKTPAWLTVYVHQCKGRNGSNAQGIQAEEKARHCQTVLDALERQGANLLVHGDNEDDLFVWEHMVVATATVARDQLHHRRRTIEAILLATTLRHPDDPSPMSDPPLQERARPRL